MKTNRLPMFILVALALGFFVGSKSLEARYPPWGR
jgi:hypothetical protein